MFGAARHGARPGGGAFGSGFARAAGRFAGGTRAVAALEAAISITFAALFFAALMQIVSTAFQADRLERAARAAARAVALLPSAPASAAALNTVACNAIRRELALDAGETCTGAWTVAIETYETPAALRDETPRAAGGTIGGEDGDIVAVKISWTPPVFSWLARAAAADPEPDAGDAAADSDADSGNADANAADTPETPEPADSSADSDNADADAAETPEAADSGTFVAVGIARNERI